MVSQVCLADQMPSQPAVTQRNFLRENKLLVRRSTLSRREQEVESNRCRCWPRTLPRAPTKSSLTRHNQAQLDMQRNPTDRQHSEKQIQTEDISDEQFLTAALLKCTEHVHSGAQGLQAQFLRGCSEGDEPCVPYAGVGCDDSSTHPHPIRRTSSNYELGTMPAQRNSCQLVPCILHPQPCVGLSFGSGSASLLKKSGNATAEDELKEEEVTNGDSDSSDKPSLHVLQLAIPDITDVEPEPQLDEPLSTRTNVSCSSQRSKRSSEIPTVVDGEQDHPTTEPKKKPAPHADQVLLTELQRISLLEAAQARYRELIWQYNRLPLSMGTLRVRNLKIQLEQQLDRIDSDLTALNLPKVYVSRDHFHQIPSVSCQGQ